MERVAIFGSTGMTGLCALEAAVEKGITFNKIQKHFIYLFLGLKVRALVRDPSKIPEQHRDKIEIIVGDVLNYDDVLKTITGVQGVVVVLGTRNNLKATTDLSEGQKNIVKAMKEANVEVISVCLSAFLFYDLDKVPEIFRDLNDDHRRQFDVLKESGLKYVAVFPPHIGGTNLKQFYTGDDIRLT